MKNRWVFLAFLAFVLFRSNAYAYIDPGAGSMLLQIFLGTVIGGVIWFRNFIGDLFRKIFKKKKLSGPPTMLRKSTDPSVTRTVSSFRQTTGFFGRCPIRPIAFSLILKKAN